MNPFTLQGSRLSGAAALSAAAAALAVTAAVASPAWAGERSSFSESRGYHNCAEAAGELEQLVKVDGDYFIYEHSDARRYYLNAYAFRSGDSVPIKIACDTTLSGHRLLDVSVDAGAYAGRLAEPVDVARN